MSEGTTNNNLSTPITVDFHGDPVTCIKNGDGIRVAMRPIAEKLGLEWTHQLRQIKADPVLGQVVAEYATPSTGTDGKIYQVKMITLPLDYLNGWLFKIDAGRYKEGDPRREVIIRYQRECYRVLHDYWHKGESINPRTQFPEHNIPVTSLADKILVWALDRIDPFDAADIVKGTGVSHSYATACLKSFARKGLIKRGRDRYYRFTAEVGMPMVRDREKVPVTSQCHLFTEEPVQPSIMPYARITDLSKGGFNRPIDKKLQFLHTRLAGDCLYFFPVQWLAEALDMPLAAVKKALDPEKHEIITDREGAIGKMIWPPEGKTYRLWFDRDTFVTTFGLRKLMQIRAGSFQFEEEKITATAKVFRAFLAMARSSGFKGREAILHANTATLKATGLDCLKLLEGGT